MKNTVHSSIFLETPRLIIRNIDPIYFDELSSQQKDPDMMTFFGGPRDDEKIKKMIQLVYDQFLQYGFSIGPVFLKETEQCIGRAGLVNLDFQKTEDVEIGCFLRKAYWNKGYATELGETLMNYAFNQLNRSRIFATIDPENKASCKIAEKFNMSFIKEEIYATLNKPVKYYVKYREDVIKKA